MAKPIVVQSGYRVELDIPLSFKAQRAKTIAEQAAVVKDEVRAFNEFLAEHKGREERARLVVETESVCSECKDTWETDGTICLSCGKAVEKGD